MFKRNIIITIGLMAYVKTGFSEDLPLASGHERSVEHVIPADVLARVKIAVEQVDNIRRYMGKPKVDAPAIVIFNAKPREVYFAAEGFLQKVNKLSFELTRSSNDFVAEGIVDDIKPYHVFEVVNSAYNKLQDMSKNLNINSQIVEEIQPFTTEPSTVLNNILIANKQINELLEKPITASDTYMAITRAINLSAFLLGTLDQTHRIPEVKLDMDRDIYPADVYVELLSCLQKINDIYEKVGFNMLEFKTLDSKAISSSDTYDLAKILVSELNFLSLNVKNNSNKIPTYYLGRKYPKDVLMRVQILSKQLEAIQANSNDNWIIKNNNES